MTIHGELTAEDWHQARWEIVRSQLVDASWQVLFVAVLLVGLVYFQIPLKLYILILGVMPLIPPVVFLAEYAILTRVHPPAPRQVLIRENALPGPRDIEIDEDGLAITGPSVAKRINWNESYRKFQIGRDYVFVFESFNRYQIFPRRWFTDEQYAEFQNHLRQGLAKRPWFWIS